MRPEQAPRCVPPVTTTWRNELSIVITPYEEGVAPVSPSLASVFRSTIDPSRPPTITTNLQRSHLLAFQSINSSLAQSLYITGLRPIQLSLPLANPPDRNSLLKFSLRTHPRTPDLRRHLHARKSDVFPLHKVVATASPSRMNIVSTAIAKCRCEEGSTCGFRSIVHKRAPPSGSVRRPDN